MAANASSASSLVTRSPATAITISAYLGSSTEFDNAVADFAETYADQNERDHAALAAAVTEGRIQAQSGV